MRLRIILLALSLLVGSFTTLFAQKEVRQQVRKGNKLFNKEEYQKAEIEYRKGLEQNATDPDTQYNLANTLYKTERGEEAGKLYLDLLKQIELLPKQKAADVAHNAGNVMMAAKDYAKAVELYKEALRRRPTDDETRYNLALAQKLLEQQNNQEQNQDQNQDQNQEQDKEQEQGQDQKDNEDKEQKNQEDSNEEQQEERMSKDNAEQILEAYLQDEKKTQEKIEQIKQQQQQGKRSRPKNW